MRSMRSGALTPPRQTHRAHPNPARTRTTPGDPATLGALEATEQVGRTGTVSQAEKGLNLFVPD